MPVFSAAAGGWQGLSLAFYFLISYLKRLWSNYLERQRFRKEVQRRLLKQRALRRLKAESGKPKKVGQFRSVQLRGMVLYPLFTLLLVVLGQQGSGQELKPLKVGDRVPDLVLENVVNYKSSSLKLSDFRGKLLILDFWATWCSPCVAMIPKMDSLQKAFDGQLQFIAVAYQPKSVIQSFMGKMESEKQVHTTIPQGYEDVLLTALFPHRSLPHYVWISGEKVISITGYEQVNAENISKVLQAQPTAMMQKNEQQPVAYDARQPLFGGANGGEPQLLYRRLLSAYSPGLGAGFRMEHADSSWTITARNQSVTALYQLAWSNGKGKIPFKKVLYRVKDASRLSSEAHGAPYLNWMAEGNVFCYELSLPDEDGDAFALMREDLQRFFPQYTASLEELTMPALVLKRTSTADKLKSKGAQPSLSFGPFGASIQNSYLNHLIIRLENYFLANDKRPVLNETGYTGKIDLELKSSLSDVKGMNQQLKAYDLEFAEEPRKVVMLVISDRKGGQAQ